MDIDTPDNSGSEKKKSKRKVVFKKDKGKKVRPPCLFVSLILRKPRKQPSFDPERVKTLASQHADTYWSFHADSDYNMIDRD